MTETITASEAATILGVSAGAHARRTLDRYQVRPIGRAPGKGGESLYDRDAVEAVQAARPGARP